MTRRTPPAITVDRHMNLGNLLKDVFEELVDIMDNSGANDLIVRRAANAVVAINRLTIALEHDLLTTVSVEMDPRFILERVYSGDDRFGYGPTDHEPDAFANWHEVR
jgi:hypothetical protein